MKEHKQTKLAVQLLQEYEEKPVKQLFSNIVENPNEAAIFALGDVVASLAPDILEVASVVETVEFEYSR